MWPGMNEGRRGPVGAGLLPTSIPGDSAGQNARLSVGHLAILGSQDVKLLPAESVEVAV